MALSQAEYKLLDTVDKRTKFTVYGFVRNIEGSFQSAINIPISIIDICILFFWRREFFEKCGDCLTITGDQRNTITNHSHNTWNNFAMGSQWIESNSSQIIKWTVQITKSTDQDEAGVYIGITSKDYDNLNNHAIYDKEVAAAYYHYYETVLVLNGRIVNWGYGDKAFVKKDSILMESLHIR